MSGTAYSHRSLRSALKECGRLRFDLARGGRRWSHRGGSGRGECVSDPRCPVRHEWCGRSHGAGGCGDLLCYDEPNDTRSIAAEVEGEERLYPDAPISGGSVRAVKGEISVLASGSAAAFSAAQPVLQAMAQTVYRVGDRPGIGAAFKVVNQPLAGVHIAVACEAVAFARRQDLDLVKIYEVITGSAGNSWMFENRVPHILAADYSPRSAVDIFISPKT